MRKILLKNSLFGLIQSIVNILLVFIVIPIFINIQGSEKYGIFAIVMVMGNLNSFTSLGLTNALVKFIAEQGKSKESDTDILVNFLMMLSISLPITLLAICLNKYILISILNVPLEFYLETKILYIWVVISNALLLLGQSFKSVLDAMQKVYITSMQQLAYNFLYWSLILISLTTGHSLAMVGFSIFISTTIWFSLTLISTLNIWGSINLQLSFHKEIKPSIQKQLKYSLKIFTSGMIGFFYEPLSKILISNFIGVSEVGFYDIALRLKNQLWSLISKIFYPLFPYISEQKDFDKIRIFIHDIEQKIFIAIIPIIAILALILEPIINLWIGSENLQIISLSAISLISFHLLFSSTVIPIYQFLMTKNHAENTIYLQLTNVVANMLVFFVFLNILGYYAIILGNAIGILVSFILSLYYQKKYLNSLIFDSYFQILKLILLYISIIFVGIFLKTTIMNSIIYGISVITISILLTLIIYRYLKILSPKDIMRYTGFQSRISNILIKILCKNA